MVTATRAAPRPTRTLIDWEYARLQEVAATANMLASAQRREQALQAAAHGALPATTLAHLVQSAAAHRPSEESVHCARFLRDYFDPVCEEYGRLRYQSRISRAPAGTPTRRLPPGTELSAILASYRRYCLAEHQTPASESVFYRTAAAVMAADNIVIPPLSGDMPYCTLCCYFHSIRQSLVSESAHSHLAAKELMERREAHEVHTGLVSIDRTLHEHLWNISLACASLPTHSAASGSDLRVFYTDRASTIPVRHEKRTTKVDSRQHGLVLVPQAILQAADISSSFPEKLTVTYTPNIFKLGSNFSTDVLVAALLELDPRGGPRTVIILYDNASKEVKNGFVVRSLSHVLLAALPSVERIILLNHMVGHGHTRLDMSKSTLHSPQKQS